MKKPKTPSLEDKIHHAYYVLRSVEFRVSGSPLWAARRVVLTGVSADEIASLMVDLQFHGF